MFSNRRRLRRWAAQVLLVWLFGLAIGVANACALGEQVHHRSHLSTTGAFEVVLKHQHGDEHGDVDKLNCIDFCEKSMTGATQLVGASLTTLGFAFPVFYAFSSIDGAEPGVGRLMVDTAHLPSGPPPRISFMRLAL